MLGLSFESNVDMYDVIIVTKCYDVTIDLFYLSLKIEMPLSRAYKNVNKRIYIAVSVGPQLLSNRLMIARFL